MPAYTLETKILEFGFSLVLVLRKKYCRTSFYVPVVLVLKIISLTSVILVLVSIGILV